MALPEPFPRDQRYVAAHSDEVEPHLFARTVLDEPLEAELQPRRRGLRARRSLGARPLGDGVA